jgi:pimeloyl-ACP methyl ester carboxylesterase/uncharacterized protein (DUF362 family)
LPDVNAIVAEFEADLLQVAREFAGRPEQEIRHLWQVALERESLVAVAYRRDIIGTRLATMPVSDRIRTLVGRAIRWAWRDEEMHALWMRGILLREGHRGERIRAWRSMVEGRVAGWTSSRQSHYRWTQAPLKRAVAEVLEVGGRVTGRIPDSVANDLHFQSFSDYCQFNVGAERTAELAWRRMSAIAQDPAAKVSDEDTEAFARIAEDEVRHGRMFQILCDAFAPDDSLREGVTADQLEAQLADVGQRFLGAPSSGNAAWDNPLGKGASVHVGEGESLGPLLKRVLADLDLHPEPGQRVAIKTTFMFAVTRTDLSPMVGRELLHALTRHFAERGCTVVVLDSPNVYDQFHGGRSVQEVAEHFDLLHPSFTLQDTQADQVEHPFLRGFGPGTVCKTWRDADLRIVLGKLRSHPSETAFLALEALEGLAGRHDDFTFSDRKADRQTALLAVADSLPPHAAILDAFADVPDGLTGMMGSTSPLQPRRLYGSRDAVSLDVVVARHLGAAPEQLLQSAAFDWFGDPRERLSVDGVDSRIAGWKGPTASASTAALSALALPLWDHASGRGALFIPPMDDAFPPLDSPNPLFAAARAATQRILETGARTQTAEALLPPREHLENGLPVRLFRSGTGPPLVLLHGYPDTLQIFSRLCRALPGFDVIAFDWPGQGYSAAQPGPIGPYPMSDQLLALLDSLSLDQVTLVASDMGAHPALITAARAPGRVSKLVVMNALLFGDGPTSWEIKVMRRSGLNRAAFRFTPRTVWKRCQDTFLDKPLPLPHHDDLWGAFKERAVREHLIALCDAAEAALPELPELYWQIRCPVLALWGQDETHFPTAQAQQLVDLLPEASLQVVPDASHWMWWSHAEQVAHAIQTFEETPCTS